jgi:hypothetical protein
MSQKNRNAPRVKLDLNNEVFQKNLLELDKTERNRVLDTLKKLLQLDWDQVYRDPGLKWEKTRLGSRKRVEQPHFAQVSSCVSSLSHPITMRPMVKSSLLTRHTISCPALRNMSLAITKALRNIALAWVEFWDFLGQLTPKKSQNRVVVRYH